MATENSKPKTQNSKLPSQSTPWPIPPLIDAEEDPIWLTWIQDMKRRDVEEILKSGSRAGDDISTRLIYENCGLEVLVWLWKHHMSVNLYISEKPLNELRKRYIRQNFDPKEPSRCIKVLATKLKVSEKFVYEALSDDPKEDPRQVKMFAEAK